MVATVSSIMLLHQVQAKVIVVECISDTTYAKNKATQKWYNFDDSHVAETTKEHLVVSLWTCEK